MTVEFAIESDDSLQPTLDAGSVERPVAPSNFMTPMVRSAAIIRWEWSKSE